MSAGFPIGATPHYDSVLFTDSRRWKREAQSTAAARAARNAAPLSDSLLSHLGRADARDAPSARRAECRFGGPLPLSTAPVMPLAYAGDARRAHSLARPLKHAPGYAAATAAHAALSAELAYRPPGSDAVWARAPDGGWLWHGRPVHA